MSNQLAGTEARAGKLSGQALVFCCETDVFFIYWF